MKSTHEPEETFSKEDIIKAADTPGAFGAGATSVRRVLGALYRTDVSAREVATLIGEAPGLTAGVLRVANSAYYGQSHSVSTVDRAVALLGLDIVRTIAAAACMRDAVLRALPSSYDNAALILHSVATAVATDALSRIIHPPLAGEAFVAGLLHDLGVPVQARLCPEGVVALVQALRRDPEQRVDDVEAALLPMGHAHCAAVVFTAWKLPASLVAAVRHHHEPGAAPEHHQRLAALVHLGNHLSLSRNLGFPAERTSAGPSPAALEILELSAMRLDAIADTLPQQVALWQAALAPA